MQSYPNESRKVSYLVFLYYFIPSCVGQSMTQTFSFIYLNKEAHIKTTARKKSKKKSKFKYYINMRSIHRIKIDLVL